MFLSGVRQGDKKMTPLIPDLAYPAHTVDQSILSEPYIIYQNVVVIRQIEKSRGQYRDGNAKALLPNRSIGIR